MTKQNNRRKYILIISAVVAVALLAVGLSIGLSQAKYKTEKVMKGKVQFTAKLAEDLAIQEHRAERNGDGSYTLVYDDIKDNEGNVTVKAGTLEDDHADLSAETFELAPGESKEVSFLIPAAESFRYNEAGQKEPVPPEGFRYFFME